MSDVEALSLAAIAWVGVVGITGGFVAGVIGFGFPIFAMPLLSLVLPFKAAILVTLLPIVFMSFIGMMSGGALRESIGRFWFMPLALIAGVWVGTRVLIQIDARPLVLVLALVLLLYLNMERLGRTEIPFIRRHPAVFAAVFAFAAGWFEATVNVAAPVLLIFFMLVKLDPRAIVQTLNFCWIGGKIIQILTWSVAGGITLGFWASTVPLALIAASAYLLGQRIRFRLPAATYIRWLRGFLWIMSGVLLIQFTWSMLQ